VKLLSFIGGWIFRSAVHPGIGTEQGGARQQEMKQGFFQHPHHALAATSGVGNTIALGLVPIHQGFT
jgi:hypothetical protein